MLVKIKQDRVFECSINQTLLDSALKTNLVLEYSCRTGRCGVCKTTLLEGQVVEIQPQIALTEQQKNNKQILTCCCAPTTDVSIDSEDLAALHGIETKTLPVRINRITKHTSEIIEVALRLPPTATFNFLEGQHLDVMQNNVRRSYSIASIPKQKEITLLIKRFENGKMSDYWFNKAKENDLLRIEGPKGTFFLRDFSKPLVFLATGTGIAPVISILNGLDKRDGFKQEHSISVYWGNRFSDEFIWKPKFKNLDVSFMEVCSKPKADWTGEIGYVQDVANKQHLGLLNSAVYACGSNSMIESAKQLFIELGLLEKQIYSDAFVQSF